MIGNSWRADEAEGMDSTEQLVRPARVSFVLLLSA